MRRRGLSRRGRARGTSCVLGGAGRERGTRLIFHGARAVIGQGGVCRSMAAAWCGRRSQAYTRDGAPSVRARGARRTGARRRSDALPGLREPRSRCTVARYCSSRTSVEPVRSTMTVWLPRARLNRTRTLYQIGLLFSRAKMDEEERILPPRSSLGIYFSQGFPRRSTPFCLSA